MERNTLTKGLLGDQRWKDLPPGTSVPTAER